MDFVEIPDAERDQIVKPNGAWVRAVEQGKTVFLPGRAHAALAGHYGHFRKRGERLHMHLAQRDGQAGVVVWADKV